MCIHFFVKESASGMLHLGLPSFCTLSTIQYSNGHNDYFCVEEWAQAMATVLKVFLCLVIGYISVLEDGHKQWIQS
jgi:hypothetical protein